MTEKRTRIPIDPRVRDKLRAQKIGGDTYDDVILRLIDEAGQSKDSAETGEGDAQRGVSAK